MLERNKKMIHFLLIFAVGAVLYFLIQKTFFLLFPIFLAYLCSEGIRNSLARIRPLAEPVKRILTVLLLLILFALLSLVTVLLVERLLYSATQTTDLLSENLENIASFCKAQIRHIEQSISRIIGQDLENRFTPYLPNLFQNFLKKGLEKLPGWIGAVAALLPRFFISLIIFVISCYYFSCDWERIRTFSEQRISPALQRGLSLWKKHFFRSLRQYGKAYLILFLLNFAILYLGLVLLKVKNAPGTAFLIAIVDLLPVLGCGTVLVPWAAVAFLTGSTGRCIGLLLLYVITLLCHQFAEPKIIGSSIGLHPILSLILVLLGLKLFGVLGMILLPLGCTSFLNVQAELKPEQPSISVSP